MISILIPTLNRSEFVLRALSYYGSVGFKGYICIGDSSDEDHAARVKGAVEDLRDKLNVIYRYFPSPSYINDAMCMKELIELAPTPYAVYSGDDDLLIPRTLEKCCAFLDSHPDYSAVSGVSVAVRLKPGGAHGQVEQAYYVGAHRLESEQASDRWIGYMRQAISTQYYVHRVETWRRMYQNVLSVPLRYLGPELLPCSLSAILGKVTVLDGLGCVFQFNDVKNFGWYTHSMYDLMTCPDWPQSACAVRDTIVSALVEQDGLELSQAQELFDREFWRHLLFMLHWHYSLHHDEPLNIYDRLKRKRALVAPYLFLKAIKAGKSHRWISLRRLLDPSNSLYADFMPIYQILTATPP